MDANQSKPLRFGVMCRPEGLPQFAVETIRSLMRGSVAEAALLIIDQEPAIPSSPSTKLRKALRLQGNLWHLQSKLFPLAKMPAHRNTSLDSMFHDLPRILCRVEYKGKYSQYFSEADIGRIQSEQLDFILKFAFGIVRGAVLNSARHGIWSFHHDDEQKYRGGPPGFWEIYHGDPVSAAFLQRLTERLDGGVALKKCYVKTQSRSYRRNLNKILMASSHMPRWVCLDLLNGSADYLSAPPSTTKAPIFKAPNDAEMLRFYTRIVKGWIDYKIENHRCEMWNIGLIKQPIEKLLDPAFKPEPQWAAYKSSTRYLADPFLWTHSGKTQILCEEFDYCGERGWISELDPEQDAILSKTTRTIDEAVHMSYPYVFEHHGAEYCCPESASQLHVPVYRLDSKTGNWQKTTRLLEGIDAVDATIFRHDGRWWMMHSLASETGAWGLHIWYADDLLGPWTPHSGNPVKIDVRSARPAGKTFVYEGQLYRPAQDCSRSYGNAVVIHRVLKLSPTDFVEEEVRRLEPDPNGPYLDGLHTLNSDGSLTIIDGKSHRWPNVRVIGWRVRKKLRNLGRWQASKQANISPSNTMQ